MEIAGRLFPLMKALNESSGADAASDLVDLERESLKVMRLRNPGPEDFTGSRRLNSDSGTMLMSGGTIAIAI